MVFSNLIDLSEHFFKTTKGPDRTLADLKQMMNLRIRISEKLLCMKFVL